MLAEKVECGEGHEVAGCVWSARVPRAGALPFVSNLPAIDSIRMIARFHLALDLISLIATVGWQKLSNEAWILFASPIRGP